MLSEGASSGKPPIVLDVRNSYEWDAGHFAGAERPLEVIFGAAFIVVGFLGYMRVTNSNHVRCSAGRA